jgi:catechol 2,3-dioxygenase-like lactoylglutathione lyase family enzyme
MSPVPQNLRFTGMHFFVKDMRASLAFYALLGLTPSRGGEHFAHIDLPDGLGLEFGTYQLTKAYDGRWTPPTGGGVNALQFALPSRDAVDELYTRLTGAGYDGRLAPFDAFWGSRYAEVCDPDGNVLGFHSPAEDERRMPLPPL